MTEPPPTRGKGEGEKARKAEEDNRAFVRQLEVSDDVDEAEQDKQRQEARVFASRAEACAWHLARVPESSDAAALLDLAALWRSRAELRDRLPNVRPMTRADANPVTQLTGVLARLGCGARVRARGDLQDAIAAGLSGSDLLLDNPCKPRPLIALARRHGVAMTTFDTEAEAARLAELWPEAAALLLVRPGDGYGQSDGEGEAALGAEPSAVPGILASARRFGLDVAGVALVGYDGWPGASGGGYGNSETYADRWAEALEAARSAAVAGRLLGHRMAVLDLGRLRPDRLWVSRFAGSVARSRWPGGVTCDPTDALLARSVVMATRVVAKRPAEEGGWRYTLGESALGAFTVGWLNQRGQEPPMPLTASSFKATPAWLEASNGCRGDSLGSYGNLPELLPGDWLLWLGRGSCGSRMSWKVNGLAELEFKCFLQSGRSPSSPPSSPVGRRSRQASATVAAASAAGCSGCADDVSTVGDAGEATNAANGDSLADICCSVLLS